MSSKFGFSTGADEVVDAFRDQVSGKNVLITGTSLKGIGAETARAVSKYANIVIITGYNESRLQQTYDSIKAEVPTANLRKLILDLSTLESVRKSAAEVNAYAEPIHVLINNAAARVGDYEVTKDGYEYQFGVSHLGPFLFTNLILPRILAARTDTYNPRIVFVASVAHSWGKLRLDDINFNNGKDYERWTAYAQVKTANILNASELARRLKEKGVLSFSLHPGSIWTNMVEASPKELMISRGILDPEGKQWDKFKWKTLSQGAATQLVAAFDPSIQDKSGSYLVDCQIHNDQLEADAADPAIASKLWALSEKFVGQTFDV